MKTARAILDKEIKANVFWQGDAPLLDPGEAMLKIASRLAATSEQLSIRLDKQIADFDERQANGTMMDCVCCGHSPEIETLDKGIQDLWKFTTKEAAALMGSIQKIGLADRAIRLQEGQAAMVGAALMAMFEALGLPESEQLRGRSVLLAKMAELEGAPGPLDGPSHVGAIVQGDWSPSESPVEVPLSRGPSDGLDPVDDLSWLDES